MNNVKVNERMLEKAVEGQLGSVAKYGDHQDAAVLFCECFFFVFVFVLRSPSTNIMSFPSFAVKKGDVYSAKVLKALENIDDECDENGIIFIKVGFHF